MSTTPVTAKMEMAEVAQILYGPEAYKCLWGGRNGVKSWSVARYLVARGAQENLRTLCLREVQETIKQSVHLLLSDQIKLLGLEAYYDIQENRILGAQPQNRDTVFTYAGLRSLVRDPTALKAYESYDVAWLEEAQTVSKTSLNTLIPTMRKKNAQIIITLNPYLEKDPIIDFVFKHPPKDIVIRQTSYRDNQWLTPKAIDDMRRLKQADPEEFNYIYEGHFKKIVEGVVYGVELENMVTEGRERSVPHDPGHPVYTYWDIGDRFTAIWFVQHYPLEVHVIDYFCEEYMGLPAIFTELMKKPYTYLKHVMPVDAKSNQLATGETIEQQARKIAGFDRIKTLPSISLKAQLSAARKVFPLCIFDAVKCADGLHALRHYQFPKDNEVTGVEHDKPLHNWASHAGSAFQYLAVGSGKDGDQQLSSKKEKQKQQYTSVVPVYAPYA